MRRNARAIVLFQPFFECGGMMSYGGRCAFGALLREDVTLRLPNVAAATVAVDPSTHLPSIARLEAATGTQIKGRQRARLRRNEVIA
jgi:hypothetical protein